VILRFGLNHAIALGHPSQFVFYIILVKLHFASWNWNCIGNREYIKTGTRRIVHVRGGTIPPIKNLTDNRVYYMVKLCSKPIKTIGGRRGHMPPYSGFDSGQSIHRIKEANHGFYSQVRPFPAV
jgi:hypothetical protein